MFSIPRLSFLVFNKINISLNNLIFKEVLLSKKKQYINFNILFFICRNMFFIPRVSFTGII